MSITPKYYGLRTTAGREIDVAMMMYNRVRIQGLEVYSIIVPPETKGYVVVEAPNVKPIYYLIADMRYVKSRQPQPIKPEEIEKLVKPKPVVEMIKEGDIVEVITGPFRGMRAEVVSINKAKNEVVLNILEASFPLPITVPGDYIKPVKKTGE